MAEAVPVRRMRPCLVAAFFRSMEFADGGAAVGAATDSPTRDDAASGGGSARFLDPIRAQMLQRRRDLTSHYFTELPLNLSSAANGFDEAC